MNFHGISSAVVLVMANEVSRNSVTINSVLNDSMIFSCVTAVFCDFLMGNAIMCRTLARCISRSEYFGRRFASCKSMSSFVHRICLNIDEYYLVVVGSRQGVSTFSNSDFRYNAWFRINLGLSERFSLVTYIRSLFWSDYLAVCVARFFERYFYVDCIRPVTLLRRASSLHVP